MKYDRRDPRCLYEEVYEQSSDEEWINGVHTKGST